MEFESFSGYFQIKRLAPPASGLLKSSSSLDRMFDRLRSKCTVYKPVTNEKIVRYCTDPQMSSNFGMRRI